tara:strand:- start:3710 stop:3898 length:189 start_codon:yes stop_codon:yes gene_type:complete
MEFKAKTIEEMHDMALTELNEYVRDVYKHISDTTAIRDYRAQIGEPRLLAAPVEVEFEEEEE